MLALLWSSGKSAKQDDTSNTHNTLIFWFFWVLTGEAHLRREKWRARWQAGSTQLPREIPHTNLLRCFKLRLALPHLHDASILGLPLQNGYEDSRMLSLAAFTFPPDAAPT